MWLLRPSYIFYFFSHHYVHGGCLVLLEVVFAWVGLCGGNILMT